MCFCFVVCRSDNLKLGGNVDNCNHINVAARGCTGRRHSGFWLGSGPNTQRCAQEVHADVLKLRRATGLRLSPLLIRKGILPKKPNIIQEIDIYKDLTIKRVSLVNALTHGV